MNVAAAELVYKKRRSICGLTSEVIARSTVLCLERPSLASWRGRRDRCTTDDGPIDSYTMVMIPAAGEDEWFPFRNRQPVVLERDSARIWLDLKADYREVVTAPAPGTLAFDPPTPVPA